MKTTGISKRLEVLEMETAKTEDRKQLESAVASMEAWVAERKREFNSPEARRIREAEYQAMLARGEEFKKECYRKWGENYDF